MVPVALALGSNLGDRERHLRGALAALASSVGDLRVSTFHETDPVGVGDQPRFLNAAATGFTTLPARDLLARLLDIEQQFGRTRPHAGAPRTLDIDLILYGDQIVEEPDLSVPHPRVRGTPVCARTACRNRLGLGGSRDRTNGGGAVAEPSQLARHTGRAAPLRVTSKDRPLAGPSGRETRGNGRS